MERPESRPPRSRSMRIVWIAALVVVACPFGVFFGALVLPMQARFESAQREVDREIHEVEALNRPVERPVVRAPVVDGNVIDVLRGLEGRFDRNRSADLRRAVDEGDVPSAVRQYLDAHRAEVEIVRQASHRSRVHLVVPFSLTAAPRDLGSYFHGGHLLLVAATLSTPGDCLEMAIDALSIADDLGAVPDFGLAAGASVLRDHAVTVASRCAVAADEASRASAANELGRLVPAQPSIGLAFERVALEGALSELQIAAYVGAIPTPGELRERWIALEAVGLLLHGSRGLRSMELSCYPGCLATFEDYQHRIATSGNAHLSIPSGGLDTLIDLHRTSIARVRLLLLALAPSRDAGLDPFSGAPFGSVGARVWSVGPDGRDQGGDGDDLVVDLSVAP